MIRIRNRARAGFSIVELLVVVVILGMVAGVATVSSMSILPSTALSKDVRTLGGRISGARSDAISRNLEFQIVYNIDESKYWVRPPFNQEGRLEPREEERAILFETRLSDGIRFAEITIDGEAYNDGLVKVRFDPLGASNDHTILLHQKTLDRYHTIEVLALTGLLRFHDGVFEREIVDDGDFD
ncbi:MAG: prepilin-type N-terminal cleavage/methylation domain-containing protein [Planctomycetota bacterium]